MAFCALIKSVWSVTERPGPNALSLKASASFLYSSGRRREGDFERRYSMASFFGKSALTLLRGQSLAPVSADEALEGKKYILVYFSAHWCPPCRIFTSKLRTFYDKYHEEKNFEIVFVSLDDAARNMESYMKTAHGDWLALPFDECKAFEKQWASQYSFHGIPTLLVFDAAPTATAGDEGKGRRLVTRYGRDMLEGDLEGEKFPWPGGDSEMQEYYRSLRRNIIIAVLIAVVIGVWLSRLSI